MARLVAVMVLLLPLVAAASKPPRLPELGWRCGAKYEIDGRPVWMFRDFETSGKIHAYFIQTLDGTQPNHETYWHIDPRAEGPPANERKDWFSGRSEAEVLRDGPDYVHVDYRWYTQVNGPVWAHYWGDGRYAGAELLFSASKVRRYTEKDGKMGGLSGGLGKGPIMTALGASRSWAFKVVDATGKELASETFAPPNLGNSVEEYRRHRLAIETLEAEFRTDFQERQNGTVSCALDEPAEATL